MLNNTIFLVSLFMLAAAALLAATAKIFAQFPHARKRLGDWAGRLCRDNGETEYAKAAGPAVPVAQETARACLETAMRRLNISFEREEEKGISTYEFQYQWGYFLITFPEREDSTLRVVMPNIYSAQLDELRHIRFVCNELNSNAVPQSVIYCANGEKNEIHCHAQSAIAPTEDAGQCERDLRRVLHELFHTRGAFVSRAEHLIEMERDMLVSDFEFEYFCKKRLNAQLAAAETAHGEEDLDYAAPLEAPHAPTLSWWLSAAGLLSAAELLRLRVVTGDGEQTVTDLEEIRGYVLHTALTGAEGAAPVRERATLLLTYRLSERMGGTAPAGPEQQLTIVVDSPRKAPDGGALFYRLTYVTLPKDPQRPCREAAAKEHCHPQSGSMTLSSDLRTARQTAAEFRYKLQEARDAAAKGEKLTSGQDEILRIEKPTAAYDLYWGNKYMREQKYLTAALHFQRCWEHLNKEMARSHKKKLEQTFHDVSFRAGYCLDELGLHRAAFYYLQCCEYSGDINHIIEYINNLVAGKDFRAVRKVESLLPQVKERINEFGKEDEPVPEDLTRFHNFLRRRLVYLNIERDRIAQAERDCHAMLDEPENADFALNELEHIRLRRERRKEESSAQPGTSPEL